MAIRAIVLPLKLYSKDSSPVYLSYSVYIGLHSL